MDFPHFKTPSLTLDALSLGDSEALLSIFSQPDVVKYYDIEAFSSVEQSSELINFFNQRYVDGLGIRWAIRHSDTGELIGTCGFNSWNKKMQNAGIGYELSSTAWGKGYATEALRWIITAAFSNDLPFGSLYRIQGDTMLGNTASESVLKKLGFREEGIRRGSGFWKNEYHDLKCFGLIKPDFKVV